MGEINRQLGIDFGTTTSAMAFRDDKGEVLPVLIDLERYTPTLILEEGGEDKYGNEAVSYYQNGGNLRSNFKLDLLSSDERVFSEAKDLTERFFGYLYRGYEDFEENEHRNRDTNDERTIVRTIVTYPGRFPDQARDVLKNAATKAGFPNVQMVTEAEAVMMYAMKYSNNRVDQIAQGNGGKPLKIMMIDMGGGTMDIAIFLYDVQNRILDQKPLFYPSKGRGSNFGGREIDELLTKFYEGCSDTLLANTPAEYRDLEVNVKYHKETWVSRQLNLNETAKAPLFMMKNKKACIERAQFEGILKDYLKKFPELVNGALDAAERAGKIEDHDVDAVILTGGNSQWYFVEKMLLNQNLIRLPKVQAEPERIVKYVTENNLNYALTIIAMGAACYGKQPTAAPVPQPVASSKQNFAPIVAQGTMEGFGTWTLDENGLLFISGKGQMPDWEYNSDTKNTTAPWRKIRDAIKQIQIAMGVTSIGSDAFYGCRSLTGITIPSSVTSIGDRAFYGCRSLTSIKIPNSVTSIGSSAFADCSSLTGITIPNSVTSIGDSAFGYCDSLTSITIPNSVTSIGSSAFKRCSSLTGITIPNSVTSIESRAFEDCTSLTGITIPSSVTSIGWCAFEDCTSLTGITIPNSVTSIEGHAFDGCTSLTGITIPNSVTSIGSHAFEYCTSLTGITLPSSVTSIGWEEFKNCTSLTRITIPNSVTSIGDYAFEGCTSLTGITLPSSVTSIGDCAFMGCTSMTSITIPNSVTQLGTDVFKYCKNLRKVTMPSRFNCFFFKFSYGISKDIVTFT